MNIDLIADIQRFVETAPLELTERICATLETSTDWYQTQVGMLPSIYSQALSDLLTRIVDTAQSQKRPPNELAFALRTAYAVEAHHREEAQLELVWSGPVFPPFSLRRTDEAILQLIQLAEHRLTLVSFALYRVDRLSQALTHAVERGVNVRMFMELDKTRTPDIEALYGDFLAANMQFYTWSDQQRLRSSKGSQGVLHAKAVIADSQRLFVSSANLTEYAMSINIELGLLLQSGELPRRVDRIFDDYVEHGVFVRK